MSLKIFHIVFISASVVMSLACAVLLLTLARDESWAVAGAVASIAAAAGLTVYGRAFLRKFANLVPRG